MKKALWITMIVVFSVLFAFTASQAKPFKIAAIFQTAIEEPWDGVIHQACLKAKKEIGNIEYEFTEKIAAADFEKVLREYAERGFDLIVGDAFLAGEEPARRVSRFTTDCGEAASCRRSSKASSSATRAPRCSTSLIRGVSTGTCGARCSIISPNSMSCSTKKSAIRRSKRELHSTSWLTACSRRCQDLWT